MECSKKSISQKHTPGKIRLFMVAMDTTSHPYQGKNFGCNDTLVPVTIKMQNPGSYRVKTLVQKLFATKGENGLANILYGANIQIQKITIHQNKAEIKLSGEFKIKGTCDIPRIKMQLRQTVLKNSKLDEVTFYINDVTMDQYLSLKG